jgi:hypothetical protein
MLNTSFIAASCWGKGIFPYTHTDPLKRISYLMGFCIGMQVLAFFKAFVKFKKTSRVLKPGKS